LKRIEVTSCGKAFQMPILQEDSDHLERVSETGERKGQIKKVQGLREEVYTPKMSEARELERCQNSPLQDLERIRDLRTLSKASQERMNDLEKDSMKNESLILQERSMLEATHKEIRRLERRIFAAEFELE